MRPRRRYRSASLPTKTGGAAPMAPLTTMPEGETPRSSATTATKVSVRPRAVKAAATGAVYEGCPHHMGPRNDSGGVVTATDGGSGRPPGGSRAWWLEAYSTVRWWGVLVGGERQCRSQRQGLSITVGGGEDDDPSSGERGRAPRSGERAESSSPCRPGGRPGAPLSRLPPLLPPLRLLPSHSLPLHPPLVLWA